MSWSFELFFCRGSQLLDMKLTIEGLEKERDFYLGKLRDIELICQEHRNDDNPILSKIMDVLYATEVNNGQQIDTKRVHLCCLERCVCVTVTVMSIINVENKVVGKCERCQLVLIWCETCSFDSLLTFQHVVAYKSAEIKAFVHMAHIEQFKFLAKYLKADFPFPVDFVDVVVIVK